MEMPSRHLEQAGYAAATSIAAATVTATAGATAGTAKGCIQVASSADRTVYVF
jgi:hypothetical protein